MNQEPATLAWRRGLIYRTIRRIGRERGRLREKKFNAAAQLLKEHGLILHHYPASVRADHVEKIDHFIKDLDSRWHYFQIKGTERAAREFLASYQGSRPITVFVLQGTETAGEVTDYILEALRGLDSIVVVR